VFNLQGSEIIIILLLALVVLGPEKLPEAMRKAGKFYADIRKMSSGFQEEFRSAIDEPVREMRETANLLRDSADFTKLQDGERDEKPQSGQMATPVLPDGEDEWAGDEDDESDHTPQADSEGAESEGAESKETGAEETAAEETGSKPATREYHVDPAAMGVPMVAGTRRRVKPSTSVDDDAEDRGETKPEWPAPFASANTLGPRPLRPPRPGADRDRPTGSSEDGDAAPTGEQPDGPAARIDPPPAPSGDNDPEASQE
jgi:sec-independent protein translocase protein TatB